MSDPQSPEAIRRRPRLIAEIRQRREEEEAAGVAAGWTAERVDALIAEIDQLCDCPYENCEAKKNTLDEARAEIADRERQIALLQNQVNVLAADNYEAKAKVSELAVKLGEAMVGSGAEADPSQSDEWRDEATQYEFQGSKRANGTTYLTCDRLPGFHYIVRPEDELTHSLSVLATYMHIWFQARRSTPSPETDVMERADRAIAEHVAGNSDGTRWWTTGKFTETVAGLRISFIRELTEYGDQRAREARAAAIEEAAQICEADYRIDDTPHELADTIRALPTIEPELELGQPDEPVSEEAALVPGASQQWFDDERAGRIRRGGEIVG